MESEITVVFSLSVNTLGNKPCMCFIVENQGVTKLQRAFFKENVKNSLYQGQFRGIFPLMMEYPVGVGGRFPISANSHVLVSSDPGGKDISVTNVALIFSTECTVTSTDLRQ
jgi:hypothetical protein